VNTPDQLSILVQKWMNKDWLAIDTEFERTDTFYPKPALIQCADDEQCYFIDPLAFEDLKVLSPVLSAGGPLKILHSMSEDIELLKQETGIIPAHLFDTQVAASLLNMGESIGYANLIAMLFSKQLDKSETRSDWTQRPLKTEQLHYAQEDVIYLYAAFESLQYQLQTQQRYEWLLEECNLLSQQSGRQQLQSPDYYLKFGQLADWPLWKQKLLAGMIDWRESRARNENKPRGWVLSDKQIISLIESLNRLPSTDESKDALRIKDWINALNDTNNTKKLLKCAGLKSSQWNEQSMIVTCIQDQIKKLESNDWQTSFQPIPHPFKGALLKRYKILRKSLKEVAESQNIPVSMLSGKKMLERLVRLAEYQQCKQFPEDISPWKRTLMEPVWLNWLDEFYEPHKMNGSI
jgi:ribonuclease D